MANAGNGFYPTTPNFVTGKTTCLQCGGEVPTGGSCRSCFNFPSATRTVTLDKKINSVKRCGMCRCHMSSRQRTYKGDLCVTCYTHINSKQNGTEIVTKVGFQNQHKCSKCDEMFKDLAFSGITVCAKCYTSDKNSSSSEPETTAPRRPPRRRPPQTKRIRNTKSDCLVMSLPVTDAQPPPPVAQQPEYRPPPSYDWQPPNNVFDNGANLYPAMYPYAGADVQTMPQNNPYYAGAPDMYNAWPPYDYPTPPVEAWNPDYSSGYNWNYPQQ